MQERCEQMPTLCEALRRRDAELESWARNPALAGASHALRHIPESGSHALLHIPESGSHALLHIPESGTVISS